MRYQETEGSLPILKLSGDDDWLRGGNERKRTEKRVKSLQLVSM